jgi:hypothetical protein
VRREERNSVRGQRTLAEPRTALKYQRFSVNQSACLVTPLTRNHRAEHALDTWLPTTGTARVSGHVEAAFGTGRPVNADP